MSESPVLLTESHDLALGGRKQYSAWFDCGADAPVECVVNQEKVGNRRDVRWFGASFIVTPAFLAGQTDKLTRLQGIPKSDLTVREATVKWGEDDFLKACRDDALLLAERAQLILNAVRFEKKKR